MTSCISKQCLKSSLSGCSLSFGKAGSSLLCGLFSSCGDRGYSLYVVCRLLAETTSLVSELGLRGMCGLQWSQHVGSVVAAPRLQSPGSAVVAAQAQSLCRMWDLLDPGIEPVSPALAGGFFTREALVRLFLLSFSLFQFVDCQFCQFYCVVLRIVHNLSYTLPENKIILLFLF